MTPKRPYNTGKSERLHGIRITPEKKKALIDLCDDHEISLTQWIEGMIDLETGSTISGTYQLPDGSWQSVGIYDSIFETIDVLKFHARGRPWKITLESR